MENKSTRYTMRKAIDLLLLLRVVTQWKRATRAMRGILFLANKRRKRTFRLNSTECPLQTALPS